MIEWVTRGLYWHKYKGERLPLGIEMKIGQLRIGEWWPTFVSDMNCFRIGGDQFLCAYNRMDDYPTVSVWVYVFHRRLVAMATTDVALQDKLTAEAQSGSTKASPKHLLRTAEADTASPIPSANRAD